MKGPYTRAKELRGALSMIDAEDLDDMPDGTIILTRIKEYAGMFTLIRFGDWFSFSVESNELMLEVACMPDPPALLVLYGSEDEEGEYEHTGPELVLLPGGKRDEPE